MSLRKRSSSRPSLGMGGGLLSVAAVAMVAPLLARLDLRLLQRCLEPSPRCSPSPVADPGQVVEAVGRRVDQVVRWGQPLVRPGCLTRGITGYYILRRAGVDVALCFGIGRVHGVGAAGHCWLVLDGEPVLETVDPRSAFAELARLSSLGLTSADPVP
jgi:Transglutaminase-like superfamily